MTSTVAQAVFGAGAQTVGPGRATTPPPGLAPVGWTLITVTGSDDSESAADSEPQAEPLSPMDSADSAEPLRVREDSESPGHGGAAPPASRRRPGRPPGFGGTINVTPSPSRPGQAVRPGPGPGQPRPGLAGARLRDRRGGAGGARQAGPRVPSRRGAAD